MPSRIAATIVVIAGIGALLWVLLDSNTTESATEALTTTTSSASAEERDLASTIDPGRGTGEAPSPDVLSPDTSPEAASTPEPAIEAPENLGPRMDLVEIDGWLNTDATTIDDFNGQVVLVEMWTFGCRNCKARIPYNQSYYEEFADDNFEIVGVHAPEFSYEADVANIENALVDLGVTWPVALDTNKKNFRAWQPGSTNFWPRTFVVDQNGDIRYDHIGEGKYEELRETIRFLIDNPPAAAVGR